MGKCHADKQSIDDAVRERNLVHLANLIRNPDAPPELRQHLADAILGLLTGKAKRPAHRPKRKFINFERERIAQHVWKLWRRDGWKKRSAAVKRTAEELGLSETTVWNAWKVFDWRDYDLQVEEAEQEAWLDYARDAAYEKRCLPQIRIVSWSTNTNFTSKQSRQWSAHCEQ